MEEWKRTPVASCEALVNSMPKRVKAVLENNGGHTKYWHFWPNLDIFTCVLTFVVSGLDIYGYVLIYFKRIANWHCYTSCTLTTLHCSKVSFLQCCHIKRYNKIFTKMWGVYSLLWDTVYTLTKMINATHLFLPPFFMSWTQRSKTFLSTEKGLFLSNIVHKSVLVSTSSLPR